MIVTASHVIEGEKARFEVVFAADPTADWYAPYTSGPQTDPTGPTAGEERVARGGAFGDPSVILRSAHRLSVDPLYQLLGFRCARGPRRQP